MAKFKKYAANDLHISGESYGAALLSRSASSQKATT